MRQTREEYTSNSDPTVENDRLAPVDGRPLFGFDSRLNRVWFSL